MVANLIERLPDEDDPQRPLKEQVAQGVAAITFVGWCQCQWIVNG